jgi:hypothetical protein
MTLHLFFGNWSVHIFSPGSSCGKIYFPIKTSHFQMHFRVDPKCSTEPLRCLLIHTSGYLCPWGVPSHTERLLFKWQLGDACMFFSPASTALQKPSYLTVWTLKGPSGERHVARKQGLLPTASSSKPAIRTSHFESKSYSLHQTFKSPKFWGR